MRSRSSFFPLTHYSKLWRFLPPSTQISKVRGHAEGCMDVIWLVLKVVTITSTNIPLSRIRDANPGRSKGTEKYPIPFYSVTKSNSGVISVVKLQLIPPSYFLMFIECSPDYAGGVVQSLGQEDALEMEMATHCSILAWRIHGLRSLAGYSQWGCKELDTPEQLNNNYTSP